MTAYLAVPEWKRNEKLRKENDRKDQLIFGVKQPSDKQNSCVKDNI